MGLAPFLVLWKYLAWRNRADAARAERYASLARFWAGIFAINFVVGVVTGIPMEFQFGSNWAGFSRYSGGVIGQPLAMEGLFAFLLESAFVGLLIYGDRWMGRGPQVLVALCVFLGSWLSGYFILVTNAFMQHPVGYEVAAGGGLQLIASFASFLLESLRRFGNRLYNMIAALVTGSFVISAVGAFYALKRIHLEQAYALFLRHGVIGCLLSTLVVAYPTGDMQAKAVAAHQEPAMAAMEGHFSSEGAAPRQPP